ncbi:MAG: response regulator [Bdellovibrionales bacterium]|nr:response regulator [Bdellovibrionales bacterium]
MKTALFIDDDEHYLYIIQRLKKRGLIPNLKEIITALDGKIALDYIIEHIDKELPDSIFVDINMPVMDGHTFLTHFNELRNKYKVLEKVVPIAVVTSSTSERDKEKIDSINFVKDYLVKDIDMIKLAEKINESLA